MSATDVGVRLRELRIAAGFKTAASLDEAADLCRGHTGMIESGRRKNPTGETLLKLCGAIGCTVADLYERGGDDTEAA